MTTGLENCASSCPIGTCANTPTIGLYVAKTSTIRAAKDLEGQTISVTNLRGTEGIAVSEWLKRGGVSPDKVKFFELPFPEVAPALVRGTIAAGIDGPTFVTDPSTPVRVLADPYAAIAPMFYTAVWCAHRQYLAQNAALIRSLVNIFNATSRFTGSRCSAIQTSPMPPSPSFCKSLKRPAIN